MKIDFNHRPWSSKNQREEGHLKECIEVNKNNKDQDHLKPEASYVKCLDKEEIIKNMQSYKVQMLCWKIKHLEEMKRSKRVQRR